MLKFTKDILTNDALIAGQRIANGFEYRILDNGQLYFTGKEYWFSYAGKEYSIDKHFKILDKATSIKFGFFTFTNWTILRGYSDKLIWKGDEYNFKKVKPDVRYSLFNKNTWGHFKFQLSKDNEIATYSFKIDIPASCIGNPYIDKPFEGKIEIQNLNLLVALAGLILVERALNNGSVD